MTFNATIQPYVQVMSNGTFILIKKKKKRKERRRRTKKKLKETLHIVCLHQKIPSNQRWVNPTFGLCCYSLETEVNMKANTSDYK